MGEYAIRVLFQKARTSEAARRALVGVMRRPQNPQFLEVLAGWILEGDKEWKATAAELVREALKVAKRGTSTSTPARSTG